MAERTSRYTEVLRDNPMLVDSALLFGKALLAAAAQGIFWLVAARLQSTAVVGVAGSLISATVPLGFLSLLGLNFSLVRLLPTSRTPSSDVVTSLLTVSVVGLVLGAAFALVTPGISDSLAFVGRSPVLVACFAVLVAGGTANIMTDSAFLVLRAVPTNLAINGVLSGGLRCLLPFAFIGAGAFGLFAAAGLSVTVAAGVGFVVLVRRLPRPERWIRPPDRLEGVIRFAGAGYLTSVLDMVPMLALPLLVIHARGPVDNGVFFVCFQVATLLNALVLAVAMSMFAEGSRHPERADAIVRRAGLVLAASVSVAVLVIVAASNLVLSVFGPDYAARGTGTLVVLALGTGGVALNNWALMRLRIAHRLRASIVTQSVTCVTILGLAAVGSTRGLPWVAAAWGVGQLAGGVVGLVGARSGQGARS